MTAPFSLDAHRLVARLEELGRIGRTFEGGVSRFSYTPEHARATRVVAAWMQEAGAEVGLDPWGNLIGVIPGSEDGLVPLAAGSHLDTVPNGGMYDGALGVLGAIEAATALREAGRRLRHPLVLVAFAEEEGTSFGVGCLGSLGAVGQAPSAETLRDGHGVAAADRIRTFRRDVGLPPREMPMPLRAYLELHIEQGPLLATRGVPLGTVDTIVGLARLPLTFLGEANHAGTTPMDARRDALWGAAEFVGALRALALRAEGRAVATVGRLSVWPGAPNVVPGRVEATAELRSPDGTLLDQLQRDVEEIARSCARRFALHAELDPWRQEPPVDLSPEVRSHIVRAAEEAGWPILTLPSWAGHDAKILARRVPAGMIFVPSLRGISHSPVEDTPREDLLRGTQVLGRALELLDSGRAP